MDQNILNKIDKLISEKKIDEAQFNLSKLSQQFHKNPQYLYLRAKIFYLNKLYYVAIDTLLIALEFEENDKIYNLISKIYNIVFSAFNYFFPIICFISILGGFSSIGYIIKVFSV